MKLNLVTASFLVVAGAAGLAGCEAMRLPAVVAGGSVIEGTGLDSKRAGSTIKQPPSVPAQPIVVLALEGSAFAPAPLKAGDGFGSDMTFDLRDGSARLGLPGAVTYFVNGPARVRFEMQQGLIYPLIETGAVDAPNGGRVATPRIAALDCKSSFHIARSAQTTTFHCAHGFLRWTRDSKLIALEDANAWVVDETQRRVTRQ